MGAVNLEARCSPAEWETRVQLAACYRLLAKFRMTDLTSTHASAMVPGAERQFLLNPFGLLEFLGSGGQRRPMLAARCRSGKRRTSNDDS